MFFFTLFSFQNTVLNNAISKLGGLMFNYIAINNGMSATFNYDYVCLIAIGRADGALYFCSNRDEVQALIPSSKYTVTSTGTSATITNNSGIAIVAIIVRDQ